MKKQIIALFIIFVMIFSFSACESFTSAAKKSDNNSSTHVLDNAKNDGNGTKKETTKRDVLSSDPTLLDVTVLDKVVYMFAGSTYDLQYTVENNNNKSKDIIWISSTDCVSVSDGVVSANKEGYAYVSANGGNECLINIIPKEMPVLSINTSGQNIASKDIYTTCKISMVTSNEEYSFNNVSAGIRLRGNSTSDYSKKPYRIKFDAKQNLLGMHGGEEFKNWVLLAEYLDDSMIRNTACLSMASLLLEEYRSDWRYVSVNINGIFNGVYVLCEQSQINSNRIDIEEAGIDSSELMSGYLFEVDASGGIPSNSNKFRIYLENYDITDLEGNAMNKEICTDNEGPFQFIALKNDRYSEDQFIFAKYYIRAIFDIIYNATYKGRAMVFADDILNHPELAEEYLQLCKDQGGCRLVETTAITPMDAIENVVNLESLADMYLFSELVCNNDDLKKSFYFWVDLSENGTKKLTFGCPWDHDGSFVSWNSYNYRPVDKYFAAKRNPWYVMIMCNDWFVEIVKHRWQEKYMISKDFQPYIDLLGDITKNYSSDFFEDAKLWNRQQNQSYQSSLTQSWIRDRVDWLNSQFGNQK